MKEYRNTARIGSRVRALPLAMMLALAAAVLGVLFVLFQMVFASRPVVALGAPFKLVGRNAPLDVEVRDARHGVKALRVSVEQGDKEHVLLDESYDPPKPEVRFHWMPSQDKKFRLAEGEGRLKVRAPERVLGRLLPRTAASIDQPFTARLVPPRVEVLTTQHYVNQGGCDMVVYRVSAGVIESGVVAGRAFFRGFPFARGERPAGPLRDLRVSLRRAGEHPAPAAGARRGGQRGARELPPEGGPQGVPLPAAARGRRVPGEGRARDPEPEPIRAGPG